MSYPERAAEGEILRRYGTELEARDAIPADIGGIDRALLHQARAAASALHVSDALSDYVLDLARATREHPRVALGLSTRGALALLRAARVHAGLRNGDFVAADDVQSVARWVMAHRLVLKPEAALDGDTDLGVVGAILEATPVPR
jgi:MoxR-like ATPase